MGPAWQQVSEAPLAVPKSNWQLPAHSPMGEPGKPKPCHTFELKCADSHAQNSTKKQSSLLPVGQIEPMEVTEHSHRVVKNQLLRIKDGMTKFLLAPLLQEQQELILDRLELVLQQLYLKAG